MELNTHWEKGYRCHGYMLQDGTRLGCVSLTPLLFGIKAIYTADIDGYLETPSVKFFRLNSAKKYVEEKCKEIYGK